LASGHWMSFFPTEMGEKGQEVGEASAPPPHPSLEKRIMHSTAEIHCLTYGVCCKTAIEPLDFDATT